MAALFGAILSLALMVPLPVVHDFQPQADPRVTVADVEKVTGLKGIQLVAPGSIPGAGAGLNFAADKHMVLMVNFGTAALYRRAKEQKTIGGMPMPLFHADVAGIGDEAFDSPPGPIQYVLYVRKGANAASFTAYYVSANKATLTMDQLKQLANIAVGRM